MAMYSAWGLAILLGLASPVWAGDCRLALVLAVDVSGSVDARENRLRHEGLARALLAPEVAAAFLSGAPVALHAFEWSGASSQAALLPGWQMIRSKEDLARVASALDRSQRVLFDPEDRGTALGAALVFAAETLTRAPQCQAWTVDATGNGQNNQRPTPAVIYTGPLLDGVTVNALIIGRTQAYGALRAEAEDGKLATWFEAEILHGPGAFWIRAYGYADYERAMTAKLLRELELPLVSGSPIARPAG